MTHTLLIVSPDAGERRKFVQLFKSAGYEFHQAVDGVSGYKAACEIRPDLVLTAVDMPGMNGGELAEKLAVLPAPPGVVVLSRNENLKRFFRPSLIRGVITGESEESQILDVIARALAIQPRAGAGSVRVVVAGSDRRTTAQMSELLAGIFCEVRQASDGGELITRVVEFSPDIILLDVLLEGMPPHEVIRTLRQMPQSSESPILLYSYYSMDNLNADNIRQKAMSVDAHQAVCLEEGGTAYIGRFNPDSFLQVLAKYLKNKSRKA